MSSDVDSERAHIFKKKCMDEARALFI